MPVTGTDVSWWNESYNPLWKRTIDWSKLYQDPVKIRFVIVKLGEGWWDGYDLARAIAQWDGAKNAGFIPGWYTYAHPELDAQHQAVYSRRRATGYLSGLPHFRDYEHRDPTVPYTVPHYLRTAAEYQVAKPHARKLLDWLRLDLEHHDRLFNRQTGVYTGAWWLSWAMIVALREGWDVSWLTARPLWNADYTPPENLIPGWSKSAIWQYTSTGKVQGAVTNLDLNTYHGTEDQLRAWAGMGPAVPEPKPEPKPEQPPADPQAPTGKIKLDSKTWVLTIRKEPKLTGLPVGYWVRGKGPEVRDLWDAARDDRGKWWGKLDQGWVSLDCTEKVPGEVSLAFAYVTRSDNSIRIV